VEAPSRDPSRQNFVSPFISRAISLPFAAVPPLLSLRSIASPTTLSAASRPQPRRLPFPVTLRFFLSLVFLFFVVERDESSLPPSDVLTLADGFQWRVRPVKFLSLWEVPDAANG